MTEQAAATRPASNSCRPTPPAVKLPTIVELHPDIVRSFSCLLRQCWQRFAAGWHIPDGTSWRRIKNSLQIALQMPCQLCRRAVAGLQEIAGERQGVAAMTGERVIEMVSADVRLPLATRKFELAHALHRDLQELEFQELKQWKYLR